MYVLNKSMHDSFYGKKLITKQRLPLADISAKNLFILSFGRMTTFRLLASARYRFGQKILVTV